MFNWAVGRHGHKLREEEEKEMPKDDFPKLNQ